MCSWGLPTWSLWAVDSPHLFTSQTLQTQQGKPIIKSLVFRHDWSLQIRPVLAPWDCLSLSLSLTQCFFPQAEIKLLFNNSVESVYSQWLKDEYVRIGGGGACKNQLFLLAFEMSVGLTFKGGSVHHTKIWLEAKEWSSLKWMDIEATEDRSIFASSPVYFIHSTFWTSKQLPSAGNQGHWNTILTSKLIFSDNGTSAVVEGAQSDSSVIKASSYSAWLPTRTYVPHF